MSKERNYLFLKVYLVYIGFVIIMGLVLYKTASIQLDGKDGFFADSDSKIPFRIVKKQARKGDILDRNLNTLLTHVPFYDIYMDPTVVSEEVFNRDINQLGVELSRVFNSRSAQYYIDKILKGRKLGNKNILLGRKVTHEQRKKIQALPILKLGRFQGGLIDDVENIQIQKPYNPMLTRTLGDARGIGIYGAYQNVIEGDDGEEIERRYATGWKKIGQVLKNPTKGSDIISTIDKEIQEVAHSELSKQIIHLEADHGSVVVMEVKTGYIRAIANLKRKSDGTCRDEYNYALGYGEVPGSTLKLASIMAGLEDGKFKITDSINAKGTYYFSGGKTLDDSNDGRGYGKITIQNAFEYSSNVIAELINDKYKDDPEKFLNQFNEFGLLSPLGIDLKGERSPVFLKPGTAQWDGISLPWMSIGYSVLQTPLQTLAFYNAIANQGKFLRPLFVEGIKGDGGNMKNIKPVILKDKICSESTLNDVQACLKGVMTRGTGKNLKSSMFQIAGKTGTAQILNSSGSYKDKNNKVKYQASFVGYFPADNPIYSCIVVIAEPNPKIAYYGSKAAGKVFAEVADKIYATSYTFHDAINESGKKDGLPSIKNGNSEDIKFLCQELDLPFQGSFSAEWINISNQGESLLNFQSIKETEGRVPNVLGMNAKDAIYLLEKKGLVVNASGFGKVISQSMSPGETIITGKQIKIVLN